MKFKIAVVQFKIKPLFPEENVKKSEEFIKKAALSKAQIIVFPEDFITGPIEEKKEFVDFDGKYRRIFQNFAKKYRIDIVPGSIIEGDKYRLYNITYYINSKGKIKSRYRKINLWDTERLHFTPGHEVSVFNTKYGKIGLIICWDLAFQEMFKKMVKKNVDIVICPSYWSYEYAGKGIKHDAKSELKFVDSLCVSRAFENEIVFVYCSPAGKLKIGKYTDTLIGHSQITVPFKGVIKKLNHNKEEMFIQEVDTAILKDAEEAYRIRRDLKKSY